MYTHPMPPLDSNTGHSRYLLSLGLLLLTVAILLALAAPVHAGDLASSDKTFIAKAAERDLLIIEMGRIANERAVKPETKALADGLVNDHTTSYEELKTFAAARGSEVPQGLGSEYRKKRDIPARRSGENFDTVYLDQTRLIHGQHLEDFKKQRNETKNEALKQLLDKTLPQLQAHQEHVKRLQPASR